MQRIHPLLSLIGDANSVPSQSARKRSISADPAIVVEYRRKVPTSSASRAFLILILAFAAAIFIIDTFTPLGIAVAALYAAVVLFAGRLFSRRGVLQVTSACVGLTVLSYVIQYGDDFTSPAFLRLLVSVSAIAITGFLTFRNQASTEALNIAQAGLAHVNRVTTLGEMSASIAHEVNQPLGAIVINGQASLRWLTREVPNIDEAVRSIRGIIDDANRAGGVIRKVRDLAKKADLDVARLNINDLIAEVATLIKHEAMSHCVSLRLQLTPGLSLVVGDRIQLQQVIINLLMNGIQSMATIAGRERILLVRTRVDKPKHVLVAIEDVGAGTDVECLDRLFDAFYTTKSDGLGMGLSVCRSIIEAHGGRIWASRNAGPGMTFQFTVREAWPVK